MSDDSCLIWAAVKNNMPLLGTTTGTQDGTDIVPIELLQIAFSLAIAGHVKNLFDDCARGSAPEM